MTQLKTSEAARRAKTKWRLKNREKMRAYKAAHRAKHQEALNAMERERHAAKAAEINAKARSRKIVAGMPAAAYRTKQARERRAYIDLVSSLREDDR